MPATEATTEDLVKQNENLEEQIKNLENQKKLQDAQKALEPEKETSNEQLKQLQDAAKILEQQKTNEENKLAITEANRKTIEATFPKGKLEPLEGEITADAKFGYATRVVAYQLMKEKATIIANKINETLANKPKEVNKEERPQLDPSKILIVNDMDWASGDLPLIQVESMLTLLETATKAQIQKNEAFLESPRGRGKAPVEAIGAGIAAATGVLSSIAEIIGYFQVNYDIKGQEFSLDSQALVSAVAGNIKDIPVFINNFYSIGSDSEVVDRFKKLLALKQDLDLTISDIKTKYTSEKSDATKKTDETKKTDDTIEKLAKERIRRSEKVSNAIDTFADSVTKAADEKTLPSLWIAALRKYIIKQKFTHMLSLKVVSSGGDAITLKSRLSSGNLAFMGGCVITFVLATVNGQIVVADTFPALAQLDYNISDDTKRSYQDVPVVATKRQIGRIEWFKRWLNL